MDSRVVAWIDVTAVTKKKAEIIEWSEAARQRQLVSQGLLLAPAVM